MKKLFETFKSKGKVNTHYFNGYGFTNKTNKFKNYLQSKGLIKDIDFCIININGEKTKNQILKLNDTENTN